MLKPGAAEEYPGSRRDVLNAERDGGFISYELALIARSAGSVASAFIDSIIHRETSNRNHILNDIDFLDSEGCCEGGLVVPG